VRLKETLAEIHPDHLVEVLESHLRDGRDDAVRQALPSLIERHPARADELRAIERRLRDAAPSVSAERVTGDAAGVFACSSCGGTLIRQAPDSIEIICQYCGTETALDDALPGARWEASLDPDARFGIGSFYTHEGTRWQVVGMQRFTGTLREWDGEDGAWETSREAWTSWWMLNAERELAWLEDHGKKRYWSVATVPRNPVPPSSDSREHEHGDWSLVDAAGEFSYRVREGERHRTVEPRSAHEASLSVETRLDEAGEPVEIEYFLSRELADREVVAGIGDVATLDGIDRWRRTRNAFLVVTLGCALGFLALRLALPSRELFRADVSLAKAMAPETLGSVTLDERFPVYALSASSVPFRRDGWLAFELEMALPDDAREAYMPFEFWRESGHDSDGPWYESDYRDEHRVRLDQRGVYRLSVVDADSSSGNITSDASLTVVSNAFSMLPSMLAGLLAFALAVLAHVRKASLASGAAALPPPEKSRR